MNSRSTASLQISLDAVLRSVREVVVDAVVWPTTFFQEPILDPSSLSDVSITFLVLQYLIIKGHNYHVIEVDESTVSRTLERENPTLALLLLSAFIVSLIVILLASCQTRISRPILTLVTFPGDAASAPTLCYGFFTMFLIETLLLFTLTFAILHAVIISAAPNLPFLFFLTLMWVGSITFSNILRKSLYQSLGD